ncbi:GxxExxY protein [Clostridium beijerinckii]
MDIVITYGNEKHIVELKLWNGEAYRLKGLEQLSTYMEEQKVDKGYLLQFNFNKNKKYTKEWIEIKNKNIFEVIV